MVRQWQEAFYGKEYSASRLGQTARGAIERVTPAGDGTYLPDFVKLAEAHGATGIRVQEKKEVTPALEKAFETRGPVVVECVVKEEENVYPMVPPGASLTEMIYGMT